MLREMCRKLGPATRVLVLELHPARTDRVGLGGNLHPGILDQCGGLGGLVVELLALARLSAIAASGDDQRQCPVGIAQAEMQRGKTAHRETDGMRLGDPERVQHGANVVAGAVLRIALGILRNVGWRVAPGVIGDTAIASRKIADLRLEAAAVISKLVDENDRGACPGLLVIEADTVIGSEVWHRHPSASEPSS